MVAFLLNAGTFLLRVFKLKHLPRPQWTIKGCVISSCLLCVCFASSSSSLASHSHSHSHPYSPGSDICAHANSCRRMGGDFHDAMPPPMSAGLSPPDEHPPSWESLNLSSPMPKDEKNDLGRTQAVGHSGQPGQLGQLGHPAHPGFAV